MNILPIRCVRTTGRWYDLAGREVVPTHLLTEELIKFFPNEPETVVVPSGYGEPQHLGISFMRADRLREAIFTCNYLTLSGINTDRVRLALPRLAEYARFVGCSCTTFASPVFGDGNDLTTVSVKSAVDSYPTMIAVRIGKDIFVKIPHSISFTRGAIIALMGEDGWIVGQYTCPMTSLVQQPAADETETETETEDDDGDDGDELRYPCEHCGVSEQGDGRRFTYITARGDEEQVCPSCRSALRSDYSVYECDDCHCLVHRTEAVTDDSDLVLCQSCFEEHDYSRCDSCGCIVRDTWYHDYTDRYLCESCFDSARDNEPSSLRGYHERPKYIWYSTSGDPAFGILYLGTECEWSTNCQQYQLADFLKENLYGCEDESRFFLMHDSSLCDGVECISMPHTLDAWLELRPRLAGVVEEISNSYHYKGESDGMHVHISRKGMSEMHELRFIALFDLCQREWEAFARRADKYDGYYMYMSNDYFGLDIDMSNGYDVLENIKDLMDRSRYRCVNATNSSTLEVRIFQTPTTTQQWFAAIEATHAAYQFTKNLSWERLYWLYKHDMLWSSFVRYSSTDPRYSDLREELRNVPMPACVSNDNEFAQAI